MFNHSQRKQYEQITSPAEKTELTNAMVNRYLLRVDRLKSDDAKQRKAIECRDVLESYYSFMTPESVEFCKLLFVQTYHI
jgi:hypothetical protein